MLHRQAHIKKIKIKKNNFKSNSDSLCVPTPPPQKKKKKQSKASGVPGKPLGKRWCCLSTRCLCNPTGHSPKALPRALQCSCSDFTAHVGKGGSKAATPQWSPLLRGDGAKLGLTRHAAAGFVNGVTQPQEHTHTTAMDWGPQPAAAGWASRP